MSTTSILLALLTVALNSAAQLLLRGAALRGATPANPLALAQSPQFVIALFAYAASVLTWLSVLKKTPLATAMPFMALTYVAVPLAARVVFGEPVSVRVLGGMGLAIAAVLLVSR